MEWKPPTSQSRTRAVLFLVALASATSASGGVIVSVCVQGVGPFDFLVDTGADTTVVHPDVARRVGLRPTARVELVTLAGTRTVPQATAALALDGTPLGTFEVLIHDLAAVRAHDAHVMGILGRGALAATPFTIDHVHGRVTLGAVPTAGAIRYEDLAGRPMVEARLRCGGRPVRLALDSGANGLVLFEGERPLRLLTPGRVAADTSGGRTWLRAGRLESLCVGNARLRDLPVAVQDRRPNDGRAEDGLLPTRLFARVHFDPRAKTVTLEPW
jgi:predicted aspartyl protease